jgi:iron complex transport system substrate-binding protein
MMFDPKHGATGLATVALIMLLWAITCMAETDGVITVVDSRNRTVTLTKPAERIIALHDHLAEAIRILGAEDRIVGIDNRAITENPEFWPRLLNRPAVGGFNPSYEKIMELNPDVVLAFASFYMEPFDKLERLEGTNIHVVAVDCFRIDTLDREMRILGKVVGSEERAEKFIAFYQGYLKQIEHRIQEIKQDERIRVYYESKNEMGHTCGPDSSSHLALMKAGAINVFSDAAITYPHVSSEAVIERNPDVIIKDISLMSGYGYAKASVKELSEIKKAIVNRPGWNEIKAVKNGKVYVSTFGSVTNPIKIAYYAKTLYPHLFQDLDLKAFHKEWLEKWEGLDYRGVYFYPLDWDKTQLN